ncbi:uncharacterized protein LOC134534504 [Bacillus rossius redtenbacheri]|uniref:uncharacterized protein LOC134534504 n=1 Tax=Bacillus rossius redtenbacheri TaxID=93214 RepID=UPI002FDE4DED
MELDKMRGYRDALASSELEWRGGASLAHSALQLMDRAVQSWNKAQSQTGDSRFHLATEVRNCMQEAALNVRLAQVLLPSVEFPHCTARQTTMMLQVVVYLMTDMQDSERSDQTLRVLSSYRDSANLLHKWLHETVDSSLMPALSEAQAQLVSLAERLHHLRLALIRAQMSPGDLELFERLLSRKSLGSITMDDVQKEHQAAGARRLDHELLFRSCKTLVVPQPDAALQQL